MIKRRTIKENPYKKASLFSKINFSWVTAKIDEAKHSEFSQEMHYDLEEEFDIKRTSIEFQKSFEKSSNLFGLMLIAFGSRAVIIILITFYAILECIQILLTYFLMDYLRKIDSKTKIDKIDLAIFFGLVLIVQYFLNIIETIAIFMVSNRMTVVKNDYVVQIIKHVFKINLKISDESSRGNILNLIQVDCENIQNEGIWIAISIYTFIVLICTIFIGVYFLGISFLCYAVTSFTFALFSAYLYKKSIKYSEELLKVKDQKLSLLSNLLSNIRFVKFNVMENFFVKIIHAYRKLELKYISINFIIFGIIAVFDWLNPSVSALGMYWSYLYIYKVMGISVFIMSQQLTATMYNIFSALPSIMSLIFKFIVMFGRMRQFFNIKEFDKSHITETKEENGIAIEIKKGVFTYTNKDEKIFNEICQEETEPDTATDPISNRDFKLEIESLELKKGEVVFIIGRIGSGKTSLIEALLGELTAQEGSQIQINGKVCYCSQQPFLMTKSIRENIIFYRPEDEAKLLNAIKMANLDEDIQAFEDGVEKILNESGMNISGGQRSRINLARCFYGQADIYLFDDPFSALDMNVSCKIIEEAIIGRLKGKTRIIVTHSIQYLKYADAIIYMENGKIISQGSFESFRQTQQFEDLKSTLATGTPTPKKKIPRKVSINEFLSTTNSTIAVKRKLSKQDAQILNHEELTGKYFLTEDRKSGRQFRLFYRLIRRYYGGLFPIVILIVIVFVVYLSYYLGGLYLADYIQSHQHEAKDLYPAMITYALITICPLLLLKLRILIQYLMCIHASKVLHKGMVIKSFHADLLRFYDKIETGRLLNRFSKDISTIDLQIANNLSTFVVHFGIGLGDIFVIGRGLTSWTWLALSIYMLILFFYQNKFVQINKDVTRLESITKTPIVNLISEIATGRQVFHCFQCEDKVLDEIMSKINENTKNILMKRSLQSWFETRITNYNIFFLQLSVFIYFVLTIDRIENPIEFAFSITFLFGIISNFKIMAQALSNLETDFVSVERCHAFEAIPIEKNYKNYEKDAKILNSEIDKKELVDFLYIKNPNFQSQKFQLSEINEYGFRKSIFTAGKIVFHKVLARYPNTEMACLKNISFQLNPGEKLGIVGKTGSGKSTIIKLITRYLSQSEGIIKIDDYDISQFDLKQLRSEMLIISQEIALFEGTILENMNPEFIGKMNRKQKSTENSKTNMQDPLIMDDNEDERKQLESEITDRLREFGFSEDKLSKDGLNFLIKTGGENLSPGEQQLISVFRAIFTQKKIIILDEATASIDYETEKALISYFFKRIKKKTLISIAHRINTVLDCDQILVLSNGEIVEKGSPSDLINNQESLFSKMYQKTNSSMGVHY